MAKAKLKDVPVQQSPQTVEGLADLVTGIENVTEKQALELIPKLRETMHYSYYALGGLLVLVQDNGWWKSDKSNYETFKDYVEEEHGISRRKAFYFMKIYTRLTAAEVPLDDVLAIGWTKLKEIADILNKENVDKWVELALKHTTMQLRELVKNHLAGSLPTSGVEPVSEGDGLSKMTFTLHADQKETVELAIEQAKAESDSTFAGVALEGICMAYLSGAHTMTTKLKSKDEEVQPVAPETGHVDELEYLISQKGLMGTLELVEQIFEGTEIQVTLPPEGKKTKKPAAKKKVAKKKVAKKKATKKVAPDKLDIAKEL